jgi:hypothetical protein
MNASSMFGKTKMLQELDKMNVNWPSMVHDVEHFLTTCICFLKKENRKKSKSKLDFSDDDKKGLLSLDLFMYDGFIFLTILDVEYDRLFVFKIEDKTKDKVVSVLETFWNSMNDEFRARIKIIFTQWKRISIR